MKATASLLAVFTACNGSVGPDDPGRPSNDAPIGQPMQNCYGTGLVNVCVDRLTREPITLTGTLSTTTSSRCSVAPECIIVGSTITVTSLRVLGSRPLILIADDWIKVDGELDASSKRTWIDRGPGSNPASCPGPQNAAQQGGGAGGTYGGRGGNGGAGTSGSVPAAPIEPVGEFLGGCPGSRGHGTQVGLGGAGGGAVFLISRGEIVVAGSINASGAGGAGAGSGGGGGGGAGGIIGLDAPSITIAGSVFANGGGGGEGGPAGAGGADPTVANAAGGAGADGGDGGAGAAGPSKTGEPGVTFATGGGGGGGGAGVVMIIPPQQTGGTISPSP